MNANGRVNILKQPTSSRVFNLYDKIPIDQKVTSFAGVPYFYEVLNKMKFDKIALPLLKYFTQAGGAMSKELSNYFIDYAKFFPR